MTFLRPILVAAGLGAWIASALAGQDAPAPASSDTTRTGTTSAASTSTAVAWSDVRDVLARHCLECHGGEARKGELSFADAATFAEGGGRGDAIDREERAQSRLLHAISYRDPELAMPPSGVLDEADAAVLRAWVLAGAEWPEGEEGRLADPAAHPLAHGVDYEAGADWWAYRALVAPDVPTPSAMAWRENPIDAFVMHALEERGITPAREADAEALLRRVTFDLVGLPPTPQERDAFLGAVGEHGFDAAWEALCDRLLDDPRHAEHQARRWLDLVRYAETNGYERDSAKPNMWRYRDWVVRAYDADLPYDEFVRAQLAGDEFAGVPRDGAIGHERAADAIATGYYRLVTWDDEPADRLQSRWDEIADVVDTTGQVFLGTTMGCARCHDHKADPVSQADYFALTAYFNHVEGYRYDGHRMVADPPGEGVFTPEEKAAAIAQLEAELRAEAERCGALEAQWEEPRALVTDARERPHEWRYRRLDAIGSAPDGWATPAFDDSDWAVGRSGFGDPSTPGSIVNTRWFTPQILLRTTFQLEAIPKSLVLSIHWDDDVVVHLNGTPVRSFEKYVTEYREFELGQDALDALVVGRNVLAVSCLQDFGGRYVDVGLRTGTVAEPAFVVRVEKNLASRPDAPDFAGVRALWARRRALLAAPVAAPYPAQVVREKGGVAEPQHVFGRGSAHAPGDVVEPHLPTVLGFVASSIEPRLPEPDPRAPSTGRRLALANWLTTDGAFLTARVEANRLWQMLFARGICRTSGDFGRLGEPPTDAALLDHLAARLVACDWDRETVLREILASRTYRLASVGPAASLAADPRNDLFWRHDPRRLTAEEYRDAVLQVSGRLVGERFGPWTYPPMDPAVLATSSKPQEAWGTSTEEEACRRSLYVHTKRSLRFPLLEALDQPSPDLPCPERFPTNVPTQALMTVNGPFTRESAAAFARSLEAAADDERERVRLALVRALARDAEEAELDRHTAFLAELRADGLDASEALDVFCLALFNLNEFCFVD